MLGVSPPLDCYVHIVINYSHISIHNILTFIVYTLSQFFSQVVVIWESTLLSVIVKASRDIDHELVDCRIKIWYYIRRWLQDVWNTRTIHVRYCCPRIWQYTYSSTCTYSYAHKSVSGCVTSSILVRAPKCTIELIILITMFYPKRVFEVITRWFYPHLVALSNAVFNQFISTHT